MLPFLPLGPFLLQMPGLALLAGIWFGSSLAEKEAARISPASGAVQLTPATIYNLIFLGLIAGVVGARLAYAVQFASAYWANPLSLLALTPATLAVEPGMIIGVAATAWYGRRKGLPLRPSLDALAPGLAAFLVALGVSHFLSGDAFGAAAYRADGHTPLPWAIYLWSDYRHPSQVYETLLALAVLGVALRRPFGDNGRGLNFLTVVALSAAARIFLEAFRGDSVIWLGGFRAAQVIGLAGLAGALWAMRSWAQPASPGGPTASAQNGAKIDSPGRL